MKTITIQIGNSDDKLSQREWAAFVNLLGRIARRYATQIHFFAPSQGHEEWQNAAWVVECAPEVIERLKLAVRYARIDFKQDAVAWTEGETEFI